ncbi:ribosomal protein L17 [Chytridium lagenaria]|nr:ribosomal protein L17 [Chytridium lagenaria]
MKHGVKIFQKKLNRSPEHRLALLRNLSSDLLLHGRIETTVPKAKFLRHAADQLIDWAKSGTEKEQKKIHQFIFQHALTLPKLRLLAARFEGRNGGYTRIIRNGLRAKGDKAPLAIVEYVDNKNDTIRLLAKKHLGKVEKRPHSASIRAV